MYSITCVIGSNLYPSTGPERKHLRTKFSFPTCILFFEINILITLVIELLFYNNINMHFFTRFTFVLNYLKRLGSWFKEILVIYIEVKDMHCFIYLSSVQQFYWQWCAFKSVQCNEGFINIKLINHQKKGFNNKLLLVSVMTSFLNP